MRCGGPKGGGDFPAGKQPTRWSDADILWHLVPWGFSMQTPPWSVASTATAHAVLLAHMSQHFCCAAESIPHCRMNPGGVVLSVQSIGRTVHSGDAAAAAAAAAASAD